ncbi:hypothetical protein PF005_g1440 [Phytophthora fragariae]|uniref:RxLR effector protein n=1 Tax=Phytophthora fragariae TaxID=53985 RepID=A0A6A3TK85_9STRA|nr:hypothetical protein PF003_g24725 [Phytophthora fragariae]KAE8948898.1 hypothetical protein PF009_g1549 [Phytophthora fragariae]KAE9029722.1 hypothetical protein PF011_g933 [Phytophthora fragariae]KAE9138391.1 hypothetical protein PF007_g1437 [Phytophthora fragariae]KAE9154856.1 hypothetical protein PF006_g1139 [Phytophthora fragariae]
MPDWLKWVWLFIFTQSGNDNSAHASRVPVPTFVHVAMRLLPTYVTLPTYLRNCNQPVTSPPSQSCTHPQ